MNKVAIHESELQVCAQILQSLAHRIRGDLSVINNDLAYLATIVDPAEVERSRTRCSAISAVLSHFGALGSYADTKTEIALDKLLKIFCVSAATDTDLERRTVSVSSVLVELAAVLLRELVGGLNGSFEHGDGAIRATIVIKSDMTRDFSEEYGSIAAFAAAQLGERFLVEAGLVDLIFRDHGWVVAVLCTDHRVAVRLEFVVS